MAFNAIYSPTILSIFGLLVALYIFILVLKYPKGSEKVAEIAKSIHEGAMAFMHREYKILFTSQDMSLDLLLRKCWQLKEFVS